MKILLPDLPFIIRMGYVCMVLISFAVLITLTDKHQIKAVVLSDKNRTNLKKAGAIFAILTGITLISGLLWGTNLFGMSLVSLGFHSIFMMTFLLGFISIIMYTNALSPIQDAKAYEFEPELFKTDKTFLIGALGIVVIIVVLYAVFW